LKLLLNHAQVPWMIRIEPTPENNLSKLSTADTFQIRSVSQQRLIKEVGIVAEEIMQEISNALAIVLDIKLLLIADALISKSMGVINKPL